jgi:hypothetical protein
MMESITRQIRDDSADEITKWMGRMIRRFVWLWNVNVIVRKRD